MGNQDTAGGSGVTGGMVESVQKGKGGKRNCSCHLKKKRFKIEAEQGHCSCNRLFGSTGYKADIFQQGGEVSISVNCQLTS